MSMRPDTDQATSDAQDDYPGCTLALQQRLEHDILKQQQTSVNSLYRPENSLKT